MSGHVLFICRLIAAKWHCEAKVSALYVYDQMVMAGHNNLLYKLKPVDRLLQARVVRQLDKVTGLSAAEKNLMLSWNIYLHDHSCLSDAQMGQRCIGFAAEQAQAMRADSELRRCFMVHLVNLWEFNIVTSDLVDACMVSIDAQS